MPVQMTLELAHRQSVKTVVSALESYRKRLKYSIIRTRLRLHSFEESYGFSTDELLQYKTADDLSGGDLDYVEWAGEAKLLSGLEAEMKEFDHVNYHIS